MTIHPQDRAHFNGRTAIPERANQAEAQGWEARMNGVGEHECPHTHRSEAHTDWFRGYDMANGRLRMIAAGR